MSLPTFMLELRDRANQDRSMQAIRTRFLLILGVWTYVVVTYLLWGMSYYLEAIHIIAGAALLANIVAYSLTRRWEFPLTVAIVSITVDIIAITFLIYFTGGLKSMFFALYLVQILGVSLFLNLSFSALTIVWAVMLVGAMELLESTGFIARPSLFIPTTNSQPTDIIIWLVFQAIMFCLVAFLGGTLSNKLKFQQRELERKRDVEKAYEALRRADESKARLLANVSHNIRTPMTSILGFSELLVSEEQSESEREELARIIHTESRHLAHLINDTFYLSGLQGDTLNWHMTVSDIAEIATEAAQAKQDSALEKGLTLTVDDQRLPLPVYGDYTSLKDVMTRLIDNAIKFTIDGAVVIRASREEDNACISISDTGIGIPAGVEDKIFEPLELIYKAEHEGVPQRTGLGLAICRAVIQHHKGRIWFESQQGKGSTFYFSLPLAEHR